ncbi:MAG: DUF3592 domain-containing protein, partial [Planctomycetota bacterium]
MASKRRTLPVLFLLLFMAVGCVPLVLGIRGVQRARQSLAWPVVDGRIVRSDLRSEQSTSRDDKGRERTTTSYYADLAYEYTVDGKPYTGTRITIVEGGSGSSADAQATMDRYPRDANVSVSYDPAAPDQSVLEPGKWGGAGWLLLFGGVFIGIPGLMMRAVLHDPKGKTDEDEKTKARALHGLVFKERILEWQPGIRIHLHRDHETLTTIVVGSVFVGLLFGIFFGAIPAGLFFFSRFGLMFVVKAYLVVSAILALTFGVWFGISHRRRDTVIDWGFHTVRAQVGWGSRQFTFNQIEGLTYRFPPKSATPDTEGKLTARVELKVDGRKYVILETEVKRLQLPLLRGKLAPILDPLSEQLGVAWSDHEMTIPFSKPAAAAKPYKGEDRELVEAIGKVGGRVVHDGSEVQEVDLSEVDGTDGIVEIVAQFSGLQHLKLKGKGITDEAVRHLTYLTDLRTLDLESTSLTDVGVGQLVALKDLESLSLKGTRIHSAAVRLLGELPGLEELGLAYTAIDDQALEYLAECEYLEYLDLTGTGVTPTAVEQLRARLPECTVVTDE